MSESTPNKDMPVIDTSAEAHTSQASSDSDIPVENNDEIAAPEMSPEMQALTDEIVDIRRLAENAEKNQTLMMSKINDIQQEVAGHRAEVSQQSAKVRMKIMQNTIRLADLSRQLALMAQPAVGPAPVQMASPEPAPPAAQQLPAVQPPAAQHLPVVQVEAQDLNPPPPVLELVVPAPQPVADEAQILLEDLLDQPDSDEEEAAVGRRRGSRRQ